MPPGEGEQQEGPSDEQKRDREEEPGEDAGRPARDAERADEEVAPQAVPATHAQLHLLPLEACQLRDGHELESPSAERGNDAFDGANRLRPVTATVVEEHDPAALALWRHRGHDLIDAGSPPVLPGEVGEDDVVPSAGDLRKSVSLLLRRGAGHG